MSVFRLCWLAILLFSNSAPASSVVIKPHITTSRAQLRKAVPSPVHSEDVLIINIIGDDQPQREQAMTHAIAFLNSFTSICKHDLHCRVFMSSATMTSGSAPSSSPMTKARQLQALTYGKSQFYPPTLTNYNIGSSSNSDPEHASEVMYALASVEKEFRDSGKAAPVALSLCFSEASAPIPEDMNMFRKIFRRVAHSPSSMKILLLEKNKDFTSPSDWHDLQVVVMALGSTHTTKWLEDMQRVFFYHANRTAFTLLEPRAAIMESVYLESNAPHVGYFSEQDVCVLHKGTRASAASAALSHALCPAGQLSRVSVPLTCSCHRRTASPKASGHGCPCSRLFPPAAWIQRISVSPTGINDRVGQNVDKFLANLPEHNKYGTARFRFTNSSDMPQGYCWETG